MQGCFIELSWCICNASAMTTCHHTICWLQLIMYKSAITYVTIIIHSQLIICWCLHLSTVWCKLKMLHKWYVAKIVSKVLYGLMKLMLTILYGRFMCLFTTTSGITGHLVCKIWLKGYCNGFGSTTWFMPSQTKSILPFHFTHSFLKLVLSSFW